MVFWLQGLEPGDDANYPVQDRGSGSWPPLASWRVLLTRPAGDYQNLLRNPGQEMVNLEISDGINVLGQHKSVFPSRWRE
jgi:hypothetical protein